MTQLTPEQLDGLIAQHERSAMIYCAMNGLSVPPIERVLTIAALRELVGIRTEIAALRRDAAWGAHNGGAHQLIKLHHADAMKLYAALKLVRPNHPLVEELRRSYCEIWRTGDGARQCASNSEDAK